MATDPTRLQVASISAISAYTREWVMGEYSTARQMAMALAVPKPPSTADRSMYYSTERARERADAYMREWTWAKPICNPIDVVISGEIPQCMGLDDITFEDIDLEEVMAQLSPLPSESGVDPVIVGIVSSQPFQKNGRLHYKPLTMTLLEIAPDGTWVAQNIATHLSHTAEYFGPGTAYTQAEMQTRIIQKALHTDIPVYLGDHRQRAPLDIAKSLCEALSGTCHYPFVPVLDGVYDVRVSGIRGDTNTDAGLAVNDTLAHLFGVEAKAGRPLRFGQATSPAKALLLQALSDANVVQHCDGKWRKIHQATCTMSDARYHELTRRAMLLNQKTFLSTLQQGLATPLSQMATVHSVSIGGKVIASALMTISGKHGKLVLGMGFHATVNALLEDETITPEFVQACRVAIAVLLEHIAIVETEEYRILSGKNRGAAPAFLGMVCGLPGTVKQSLVDQPRCWNTTIRYHKDHMKALDTVTVTKAGPCKGVGTVVLRSTKPMPKPGQPVAKRAHQQDKI